MEDAIFKIKKFMARSITRWRRKLSQLRQVLANSLSFKESSLLFLIMDGKYWPLDCVNSPIEGIMRPCICERAASAPLAFGSLWQYPRNEGGLVFEFCKKKSAKRNGNQGVVIEREVRQPRRRSRLRQCKQWEELDQMGVNGL